MKILVVGGGGREHALCDKLAQSPKVTQVICAPGNAGIADSFTCFPIEADDVEAQFNLALKEKPDLVVIGPEAPLVAGLADMLTEAGIKVFGPSKAASMLEGSKIFSKEFMIRNGIPTATFTTHDNSDDAVAEIIRRNGLCVIKADGLAGGKGVLLCNNILEAKSAICKIFDKNRFGTAGNKVVIEDYLQGEEVSVLAICDGKNYISLIPAQDHKAAYEGDTGPNTGGMGAYCPAPLVTPQLQKKIQEQVLSKTINALNNEGLNFVGVLYAGLMIDGDNISVLEFNVRFGDPECQPLLAMLKSDLAPVLYDAASGNLKETTLEWHEGFAICVVICAQGYPGPYVRLEPISGLDKIERKDDMMVFHGGTTKENGQFLTEGGRVLGVTARGETLEQAAQKAYPVCETIKFKGMRYRKDIGHRALKK